MNFPEKIRLLGYRLRSYLTYLSKRTGAHGIHPPFIFQLYTQVLSEKRHFYAFDQIEELRNALLSDQTNVDVQDFGAGSIRLNRRSIRTIGSIVRTSTKPARQARMLFRLAEMAKPVVALELGTNLGLTTAYLASAVSPGTVISIEGDPALANLALENLSKIGIRNAKISTAKFDDALPDILRSREIDFYFIDGNHTREATLRYWNLITPHLKANSVVVFDDIHWSRGMEEAWKEIISHPAVKLSMDFYCMGVLIFREDLTRQHFVLKMPS